MLKVNVMVYLVYESSKGYKDLVCAFSNVESAISFANSVKSDGFTYRVYAVPYGLYFATVKSLVPVYTV